MLKDCQDYEKILFRIATQKTSIDFDDGVKMNYQKFKNVLVPIKGLEKEEEYMLADIYPIGYLTAKIIIFIPAKV